MAKEVKIREDLNNIVKDIKFGLVKTRYNERKVCSVSVFNGDTIEFSDTEGLYDMIATHKKLGMDCIKSKQLVEELVKNPSEEDEESDVSLGIDRVLGLYKLSNSRRWYDKVSILSYAMKTMSTLPKEDFYTIMEGITVTANPESVA